MGGSFSVWNVDCVGLTYFLHINTFGCLQTAFPFVIFMNSVVPVTFSKDCLLPLCPSMLSSIQRGGPALKEGLEEATETRREGKEKSRDPSQTGGCISRLSWED